MTITLDSFSTGESGGERQAGSSGFFRVSSPECSGKDNDLRLPFPWPMLRAAHPVLPVFLPFAGCPSRCVFCAQDRQTGVTPIGTEGMDVPRALDALSAIMERRAANRAEPVEIAFFGGTFTAQPEKIQEACLARLRPWIAEGLVAAARCSTRPDAVRLEQLVHLKSLGLGAVELGIQSFSNRALSETRRAYTGEQAADACLLVREAGLALGVQLMPGMPGADAAAFQKDTGRTVELNAAFLRVYPCLVLEGTELAHIWRAGAYTPWKLERTVRELAWALLAAGKAGLPVIRMGLPLGENFMRHVLAGPAHPALGSLVQAEALYQYISVCAAGRNVAALRLPRNCQGFFWGERGAMRGRWASLGLGGENVFWEETP